MLSWVQRGARARINQRTAGVSSSKLKLVQSVQLQDVAGQGWLVLSLLRLKQDLASKPLPRNGTVCRDSSAVLLAPKASEQSFF